MNKLANWIGILAVFILAISTLYFAGIEQLKYGFLIAMVLFIIQLIIKITTVMKELKKKSND